MKIIVVTIGEYDDKTPYIVVGAKDAADAEAKVLAWYKENYCGDLSWEPVQVVELTLKKGVYKL